MDVDAAPPSPGATPVDTHGEDKRRPPTPSTPPRPREPPHPTSVSARPPSADGGAPWQTLAAGAGVLPHTAPAARAALLPVPHVRQAYSWDCGLACALMVMRAAGGDGGGASLASLRAAVGTRSVWTIDVAHLLARAGLPVTLTTVTPGANPAYEGEAFYSPTLARDAARVARLFAAAPAAGVDVQRRRVTAGELGARLLGGEEAVVALVDRRALAAAWPPSVAWGGGGGGALSASSSSTTSSSGYMGHYVVLCGYDPATHTFALRDPAAHAGPAPLRVPGAALDAARTAFGTDEDLLIVRVRDGGRDGVAAMEEGGRAVAVPA